MPRVLESPEFLQEKMLVSLNGMQTNPNYGTVVSAGGKNGIIANIPKGSVQFSHSVVSDSL